MRCTICFITCHHVSPQEEKRGTEKPEKQRQKQEERTTSNGRKRIGMREWQALNKKNGGTGGTVEGSRNATKPTKEKIVLCRVGSELSLVPASLCHSIRQEEDFVWEILAVWIHWDIMSRQKYRRQMFLDIVLCVVGRFAC